jgi:methoxymalonate biosynthesis acyl carrier protein
MFNDAHRRIRDFIAPRFPSHPLKDGEDMFSLGFVNSLFAMELVLFIEKEFGFRIPNEEMDLDNFRTVDAMVALVGRLALPAGVQVGAS